MRIPLTLTLPLLLAVPLTAQAAVTLSANGQTYSYGIYTLKNEWFTVPSGFWQNEVLYNPSQILMNWNIPGGNIDGGIRAFPHIEYNRASEIRVQPTEMPTAINWNKNLKVSFTVDPGGSSGNYHALIDAWVDSDWGGDWPPTAEIGIFPYDSISNASYSWATYKGQFTLEGTTWKMYTYQYPNSWMFVLYVRTSNTTSIQNLNVMSFARHSASLGVVNPAHYVQAVNTGFESIWGYGAPGLNGYTVVGPTK